MKGEIKGSVAMTRKLQQIAKMFPQRVGAALYQEGQIEMTESKRRVPVETGTLRASGQVSEPEHVGRNITVTLSYGGAAKDYAIIQHENPDFIHKVGQWKYLESVLNESRSHMAARLARRIDLNRMRV